MVREAREELQYMLDGAISEEEMFARELGSEVLVTRVTSSAVQKRLL